MVLQEQGWTAAEWARRADVTSTNLTRFLKNPENGSLPGAATIGRLARAAGSEPRFLENGHVIDVWRVPLLTLAQLKTMRSLSRRAAQAFIGDALRDGGQCVLHDRQTSPRAFALQISSHHLNASGVILDDRIIVEPEDLLPPRNGDLVVVVDGNSVCGYRFHPPYLIPTSTDSSCIPMRCDGATMVGVGIQIVRPLRN